MVVMPWVYRNYKVFGIAEISSITGTNLFDCNYRYMLEDQNTVNVDSVLNKKMSIAFSTINTKKLNCMSESIILRNIAQKEIKNNLHDYINTIVKRHPRLYGGTGTIALFSMFGDTSAVAYLKKFNSNIFLFKKIQFLPYSIQMISWILLAIFYILFFYSLITLFTEKKYYIFSFLLFSIIYLAIVIGPVVATRYRFVMLPFFSIAAAYGFQHFRRLSLKNYILYKIC